MSTFKILEVIGSGGMGVVHRAIQMPLGREVALKFLKDDHRQCSETVARFHREVATLAKLSHPGIIQIYDSGEMDGRLFFAMELIQDGVGLDRLLAAESPLALTRVLELTTQILLAIEHCHASNILHRDIKPANVLVRSGDRVILTDFGLAKNLASEATVLTEHGSTVGTPRFMAPEQVAGREPSPATDLWAVGLTLYEMATGRSAFQAFTLAELLGSIKSGTYAPPTAIRNDLPAAFDDLVAQFLRVDPKARVASAQDALEKVASLRDAVGGRAVGAPARRPSRASAAGSARLDDLTTVRLEARGASVGTDRPARDAGRGAPAAAPRSTAAVVAALAVMSVLGGVTWQLARPGPAASLAPGRSASASAPPPSASTSSTHAAFRAAETARDALARTLTIATRLARGPDIASPSALRAKFVRIWEESLAEVARALDVLPVTRTEPGNAVDAAGLDGAAWILMMAFRTALASGENYAEALRVLSSRHGRSDPLDLAEYSRFGEELDLVRNRLGGLVTGTLARYLERGPAVGTAGWQVGRLCILAAGRWTLGTRAAMAARAAEVSTLARRAFAQVTAADRTDPLDAELVQCILKALEHVGANAVARALVEDARAAYGKAVRDPSIKVDRRTLLVHFDLQSAWLGWTLAPLSVSASRREREQALSEWVALRDRTLAAWAEAPRRPTEPLAPGRVVGPTPTETSLLDERLGAAAGIIRQINGALGPGSRGTPRPDGP